MTKPLNAEMITGFCKCLGCTFPDGVDSMALRITGADDDETTTADDLSITIIGHGPATKELCRKIKRSSNLVGGYGGWTRVDLQSKCLRMSGKGGPAWGQVEARIAMDARTGEVLAVETSKQMNK